MFSGRLLIINAVNYICLQPVQNAGNQFLTSNEVVSSTEERKQMSQPESSALCAFIPSTAYPASENCILQQSRNDVAVTELANAPNIMNQMDLINRLNKHVVVPLPTIQAVANVHIPVSQDGLVLPDSGSASALIGLLVVFDL